MSDSRPFRSWESAQEEKQPSFWTRLRRGFSRKPDSGIVAAETGETRVEPVGETLLEPQSDLKFFEAPTEIVPELALRPKPGFFLRLFRRRKTQSSGEPFAHNADQSGLLDEEPLIPTNEYPADVAPTGEPEPFVSVEDALPKSAQAVPELGDATPSVLSRLFGKKKPRSSLEVEIHEDRIAAAADALQEVGDQTFAEQLEEPVAPNAFDSVDAALPDLPLIELQEVPPTIQPERPASDASAYFGETLDPNRFPEVDDGDTDEFEIVTGVVTSDAAFAETQPGIGVDDDTAQVSRKSLIQKLLAWRQKAKDEVSESATVVEAPPVFLFSKFRMFYNEIIRLKHQKTELSAGFSTAIMSDSTTDITPEGTAEATSKSLVSMLVLQASEAMWMGGEAAERYPEAQYAMAALADDLLLHMEWEGKYAWHKYSLEQQLFKTRAADVELFRRIDRLLKELPDSASARDLARVYLFVIAAGFKGKYRQFGLTRALAEYRQRLYEYIHHGADALLLYDDERRIFPDTTKNTLVGHAVGRFSAAQRWAAILVFLVASYTLVAHFAWTRVSADLEDVTARIKATATSTP